MTNQVLIDDLQLVSVPAWWENPWAWAAIALAAAAAIYFWRRWLKTRPLPLKMPRPTPPGPPPHLDALRRLAELRERHAKINAYDVATECADILRRYIEGRYALPIRFQTTREFLAAAASNGGLTAEARRELGDFLEFFDGIKFAQESAAIERTGAAIDGAERFVRRCIPAENVPAS